MSPPASITDAILKSTARLRHCEIAPDIERLLAEKFELTQAATRELLKLAEATAESSNQLHPFTRLAVQRMDPQQRIRLVEMLWETAYADGVLDPEEDALLRRVAGLIYVSDADRVAARQRVVKRLGIKPEG